MLDELKSPVIATDGETGSVRTFLFDNQSWNVSWLVVTWRADLNGAMWCFPLRRSNSPAGLIKPVALI